jgi:hypothetical protein
MLRRADKAAAETAREPGAPDFEPPLLIVTNNPAIRQTLLR